MLVPLLLCRKWHVGSTWGEKGVLSRGKKGKGRSRRFVPKGKGVSVRDGDWWGRAHVIDGRTLSPSLISIDLEQHTSQCFFRRQFVRPRGNYEFGNTIYGVYSRCPRYYAGRRQPLLALSNSRSLINQYNSLRPICDERAPERRPLCNGHRLELIVARDKGNGKKTTPTDARCNWGKPHVNEKGEKTIRKLPH